MQPWPPRLLKNSLQTMDEIDKIVVECTEIQDVNVETQTTTLRTNVDRSLLRDRLRLNSLLTLNLSAYTSRVYTSCHYDHLHAWTRRHGGQVLPFTYVMFTIIALGRITSRKLGVDSHISYMEIILNGIRKRLISFWL